MELIFYKCNVCGQIVATVKGTGMPITCCGEEMSMLVSGSVDASLEKHVPVISRRCCKVVVSVGEEEHPMTEDHYIEWIAIQTKTGNQRKLLAPGDKPEACFRICKDDTVIAAYAYCNLHSLWRVKVML